MDSKSSGYLFKFQRSNQIPSKLSFFSSLTIALGIIFLFGVTKGITLNSIYFLNYLNLYKFVVLLYN